MAKAKPFIKCVGGKTQLIEQLDAHLPADFGNWENVTYIEPFVGGGAMLFYMLQQYYTLQDMEAKREMFMAVRQLYNEKNLDPIENTTKMV